MSPNHPDFYPDDENVVYDIRVPKTQRVAIHLLRMGLETKYDYLYVNDTATGKITWVWTCFIKLYT